MQRIKVTQNNLFELETTESGKKNILLYLNPEKCGQWLVSLNDQEEIWTLIHVGSFFNGYINIYVCIVINIFNKKDAQCVLTVICMMSVPTRYQCDIFEKKNILEIMK